MLIARWLPRSAIAAVTAVGGGAAATVPPPATFPSGAGGMLWSKAHVVLFSAPHGTGRHPEATWV
jgi:hypothetical protein